MLHRNGAGGLSSSIGELATITNGAYVELKDVPLKYSGLKPWEIFVSESQERMTIVVEEPKMKAFMDLALEMEVESVDIGYFTSSGYLHVCYDSNTVAYLCLEFLHNAVPRKHLFAEWENPKKSLTEDGPKLLEYNVRMGDPEACVLLPSLKSNLYDIIEASLAGRLREHEFEFHEGYFTDVVLVADGYPAKFHKGNKIEIKTTQDSDTLIFHAGTKLVDNHLLSNGGRVLNIVSSGKTLNSSLMKVYKAINFKGASKRCDIDRRNKTRLAILISGRGSNMEAIIKNCLYDDGILQDCAFPSVIISNCQKAKGLESAESYGIDTIVIESDNKTREIFEGELIQALAPYNPDFIILAGFDRILTSRFLGNYKDKVINIHPADTKQYKGLHGYKWAFENKLKETLITVHFVDEGIDTGKVIAKQKIDISKAKSLDEVEEIGLRSEHELYSHAIRSLIRRD